MADLPWHGRGQQFESAYAYQIRKPQSYDWGFFCACYMWVVGEILCLKPYFIEYAVIKTVNPHILCRKNKSVVNVLEQKVK